MRINTYLALTNREARLEQNIIHVVLLINGEQIITAHQQFHVGIGEHELVIIVVDISRHAMLIVFDVGIIETTHIFALDQLRRLPIGIAVSHAITQVMNIIVNVVKVDDQTVVTVHQQHRRDVHIACQAHLE